jgi:hypothetical protein
MNSNQKKILRFWALIRNHPKAEYSLTRLSLKGHTHQTLAIDPLKQSRCIWTFPVNFWACQLLLSIVVIRKLQPQVDMHVVNWSSLCVGLTSRWGWRPQRILSSSFSLRVLLYIFNDCRFLIVKIVVFMLSRIRFVTFIYDRVSMYLTYIYCCSHTFTLHHTEIGRINFLFYFYCIVVTSALSCPHMILTI